jgi:hypothetical protein
MAEIKSTLDLIMEKTKGLTLSPEEKEKILREEWLKKAKGWIQKFLDDRIDLGKVKDELSNREKPLDWKSILKRELITGLDPEKENEKRFQLITEFLEMPREPFLELLKAFDQKVEGEKVRLTEQSIKRLSAQGISGSAILPNLDRDPAWIQLLDQEMKAVKEKLADL